MNYENEWLLLFSIMQSKYEAFLREAQSHLYDPKLYSQMQINGSDEELQYTYLDALYALRTVYETAKKTREQLKQNEDSNDTF